MEYTLEDDPDPENHWLVEDFTLFQGAIVRVYVSFRECNIMIYNDGYNDGISNERMPKVS